MTINRQTELPSHFSARLTQELSALDWKSRSELLIRIGRSELQMRSHGQDRPIWKGPASESDLLGADVVVPTEQGERRGRVICFGVVNTGDVYERTVVVHVPASGSQHEAPGSVVRMASFEDAQRIQEELEMAARLQTAVEAVQTGSLALPVNPTRKRGQRDPRLVGEFVTLANASEHVKFIDETPAYHKVVGTNPARRLYVFKNQLQVALSGFSFEHLGILPISAEEAKEMHLGKVRGRVKFEDRDTALDAFERALKMLSQPDRRP